MSEDEGGGSDEHGAADLRRAHPRARRNDRALRAISRWSATRLFRERCTGTNRRDAGRGRGRLGREHRPAQPRGRGVETDPRLHQVDSQLRTAAPGIYAAGDVTGHLMVVHEAAREGYLADQRHRRKHGGPAAEVSPLGSFTDPEYASVGLSEATARETHDVVVGTESFGSMPRPIIDGRPTGFCKLVADRENHTILGCHIVGERAVELAQLAAPAVASGMKVEQLALVPFSFPTYANALGRAAVRAARQLDSRSAWAEEGMAWTPAPPSMTEAPSDLEIDHRRAQRPASTHLVDSGDRDREGSLVPPAGLQDGRSGPPATRALVGAVIGS